MKTVRVNGLVAAGKIKEVAGHLREAGKASFILGAGASISAGIPSAGGLIKLVAQNYPTAYDRLNETDRKNYGRVMSAIFPGDREKLIVPLLEKAKTNWGHIALATLLRKNLVERVLTFNFDLLVERSASMLGVHLPVYDFAVAASGDVNRVVAPSIVHLHGQGHGMVLLNSDVETRAHADRLRPILADTLRNHLTIVIGYSGEADDAFPVIRSEYNSRTRLIWLGHAADPPAHLQSFFAETKAEYIGGCDFDRVMIGIAKELGAWPPTILKNPMDHVLEVLEPAADFPVGEADEADFLSAIRARLSEFSVRWEADSTPDSRAYDLGLGIAPAKTAPDPGLAVVLSEGARTATAWALVAEGISLDGEARTLGGDAARAKWAEAGQKFAQALAIKPDMHEALCNWGIALTVEARTLGGDAARAKWAEAGQKYAQALAIKPDKHEALSNWAAALGGLAHLQAGEERAATLQKAQDLAEKSAALTGKATYNLACIHALRGETEPALAVLRACQADGTLPDVAHLDRDADLHAIRGDAEFRAFRAGLG